LNDFYSTKLKKYHIYYKISSANFGLTVKYWSRCKKYYILRNKVMLTYCWAFIISWIVWDYLLKKVNRHC